MQHFSATGSVTPATEEAITLAIDILKRGGLVAFPTDTVYGLGASMGSDAALERVYQIKQRPRNQALPLLLADAPDLVKVVHPVSELAWRLVEYLWPGALTLVLPKAATVPKLVSTTRSVAVRLPNHPVPRALARGLGLPITGTSANLSGLPSPVTAQEVASQLADGVDLIIDGGPCWAGVESTIIDLSGSEPLLLRQGAIKLSDIEKACGIKIATRRQDANRVGL